MLPSQLQTIPANGAMDEEEVAELSFFLEDGSLCPMYFGVSFAFFVLRLLSVSNPMEKEWSEVRERTLLALLIWRVHGGGIYRQNSELRQKLEKKEREVEELKRIRREDAKANEKVVAIFAAHEHGWLTEKKKLQWQIGSLMNQLGLSEKKRSEAVAELNGELKEMELILEEERQNRREIEEKLSNAESVAEELRENLIHQTNEHSSELWKHKTAFMELVSNHRQLEAELARMTKQVEDTKEELKSVLEQKADAVWLVQSLSTEIIKMQKEAKQKEKILSEMMRKSQLDKQKHLTEVKLSKIRKKQAEMETGRWREVSQSRHGRQPLMANQTSSRTDDFSGDLELNSDVKKSFSIRKFRSKSADLVADYGFPEFIEESDAFSPLTGHFFQEGNEDLGKPADIQWLESLVLSEAEKYTAMLQERNHQEIDALTEQIMLKDEKLEAFCWKLLSNELESRQNVEELNKEILHLRHEKTKLDALLYKRENEIAALKKQIALRAKKSQENLKTIFNSPPWNAEKNSWSKLKIRKPKPGEKERKTRRNPIKVSGKEYIEKEDFGESPEIGFELKIRKTRSREKEQKTRTNSTEVSEMEYIEKEETFSINQVKDYGESPEMGFEDGEKSYQKGNVSPGDIDFNQIPKQKSSKTSNSPWRTDLQALGVSYKIKRLRKQVLMLERLMGKKESGCDGGGFDNEQDFLVLMSLLNKQVCRYLSLQGKIDDLCQRMHEEGGDTGRRKGKTKALENFLEETFQVQRYMVGAGQKLMEIQSKISSIFDRAEELRNSAGFDVKLFADNVRNLYLEVQRGLEVRIARIIGDVEGTLACEGMRLKEI